MLELNHANILKLYSVYETNNTLTLILDLLSGGNLYEKIVKSENLTQV